MNPYRLRPLHVLLVLGALIVAPATVPAQETGSEALLRRGLDLLARGAFEAAVPHLSRAATGFESEGRAAGQLRATLALAEARAALGLYRQAEADLQVALSLTDQEKDDRQAATILARLANVQDALDQPAPADRSMQRALSLARRHAGTLVLATVLNEAGNLDAARGKGPEAVAAYRESASVAVGAGQPLLAARALANAAAALTAAGAHVEAEQALAAAFVHASAVAPSHEAASTLVTIGIGLQRLRGRSPSARERLTLDAFRTLQQGAAMAETIGDRRSASFAWGLLGTLYEEQGRHEDALTLTRRAARAAQQGNAPESLYRWQWQAGRLLNRLGARDAAIASYRRAVGTLQGIRPELSTRERDRGASFRETLGGVYFELVDLLLQRAAAAPAQSQPDLAEAREVVELFKVAELRDYFRDDCVDLALQKVTPLDVLSQSALIVYPIMLPDRTELLLSLPTGMKQIRVPIGAAQLTQEVRQFRRLLEKRTTREYLPHAQMLYDWLIRPLEPELAAREVQTLVFIPDGPLRTIPMAALHDGREFLVAKHALGTTPGLNVTDPRPIKREGARVLAVGVTQAVQGFPALPSVSPELEALQKIFPVTTLVDAEFRLPRFEQTLKEQPFTILHVASHGEFGGTPGTTFLLAFDDKLTMDRLDRFIGLFKYREEPLELLTLSACDTAEGDDRAALGLAGVAVKAGARSALASLWSVNDPASAELVAEFYRQLRVPGVSRAGALQRAQLKLLGHPSYEHPGFWAPFLLISNWL